ncbi:MAG: hypothetical protein FJ279_37750, partial [Planctomycetes bacterium]|nr:hypothetical protein [Planctomycetota bacterium]
MRVRWWAYLCLVLAAAGVCLAATEQEGLALLAQGKPVEALAKFAQMDSEREGVRKAELLCKAAGDLRVEDPDPWLDQAKVLLERKGTASELLRELQLTRQAVEYVRLRGYDASKRKTLMGFYERLSAADNMLKTLPADSPFSDLAALWRGRIHLWRAREGGHNEGYKIAKEIFARLKEKYPDHRLIRMYLGEQVPSLVTYKLEVPESAPEWAVKAREALVRATDVFHWWVEHRQIETGEMGGGWGDDCEMLRNWPIAILAGDDGLVRVGWRKLAHGIWENGGIFRGYARGMTDVEHGAEDIGDTHAAMIGLDYGNPAFVSRCLMPMKQMRDVWTGLNPQGHRHFKSHYFSATEVRAHKGDDTDTCYCARATQPGIWAAWYSRNPALLALFREYAAGWVAHLDRTDADKPP